MAGWGIILVFVKQPCNRSKPLVFILQQVLSRGMERGHSMILCNAPKCSKDLQVHLPEWHPMTSLYLNNMCVSCQSTGTLEFSESIYIHLVFLCSRLCSLNKPKVLSLRNTHNCEDEFMFPTNDNHDGWNHDHSQPNASHSKISLYHQKPGNSGTTEVANLWLRCSMPSIVVIWPERRTFIGHDGTMMVQCTFYNKICV